MHEGVECPACGHLQTLQTARWFTDNTYDMNCVKCGAYLFGGSRMLVTNKFELTWGSAAEDAANMTDTEDELMSTTRV
jgi:hypothetical protein